MNRAIGLGPCHNAAEEPAEPDNPTGDESTSDSGRDYGDETSETNEGDSAGSNPT